jgi:uroporphyrinogen-III synthase
VNKSLFISKCTDEVLALVEWCKHMGVDLYAESLIGFEAVPFKQLMPHPIVFFSSKRSVQFYVEQPNLFESNTLVACIGKATQAYLESLGYNVHFCGTAAGNPNEVAQEFLSWAGTRTVLFPVSSLSLNSISNVFPVAQKEVQVVYETTLTPKLIQPCNTYVFTSPSNVEAFFLENKLDQQANCIAWGKSTAQTLKNKGVWANKILSTSSITELLDYLSSEQA